MQIVEKGNAKVINALTICLGDSIDEVRRLAVEALAHLAGKGDTHAIASVSARLQSSAPNAMCAAVEALHRMAGKGDAQAIAAVSARLQVLPHEELRTECANDSWATNCDAIGELLQWSFDVPPNSGDVSNTQATQERCAELDVLLRSIIRETDVMHQWAGLVASQPRRWGRDDRDETAKQASFHGPRLLCAALRRLLRRLHRRLLSSTS
jgi:hypothetical protein